MTQAASNTDPTPTSSPTADPAAKILAEFQKDYAPALEEAKEAMALSRTDRWQQIYASRVSEDIKDRERIAKDLELRAAQVRELEPHRRFLDEDLKAGEYVVKGTKEAAKELDGHMVSEAHWTDHTLGKVVGPVEACLKLRMGVWRQIKSMVTATPMFAADAAVRCEELLRSLDRPKFDWDTGVVTMETDKAN